MRNSPFSNLNNRFKSFLLLQLFYTRIYYSLFYFIFATMSEAFKHISAHQTRAELLCGYWAKRIKCSCFQLVEAEWGWKGIRKKSSESIINRLDTKRTQDEKVSSGKSQIEAKLSEPSVCWRWNKKNQLKLTSHHELRTRRATWCDLMRLWTYRNWVNMLKIMS